MSIKKLEFADLEKEISRTGKPFREILASDSGKVYVVAITRDDCPACARQKPRFENLAAVMARSSSNKVVFLQIHVHRPPDSEQESLRSKNLLGHYFYPTDLILIRTADRGAVECYRNIAPRISELRRNIESLLETVKEMTKSAD